MRLRTQAYRWLLWHRSYTNRWRQLRTLSTSLVISFARALASLKIIYVWSVNAWQPLSIAVPNVVPGMVSCLFSFTLFYSGSAAHFWLCSAELLPPSTYQWRLVKDCATWPWSLGEKKICSFTQWHHYSYLNFKRLKIGIYLLRQWI